MEPLTEHAVPFGKDLVLGQLELTSDSTNPATPEDLTVKEGEEPNVVISRFKRPGWNGEDRHHILLDIDRPAYLLPSSTPGHHHLYIGAGVPWGSIVKLLDALEDCGVLDTGYVEASKKRGYTTLRLPWVRK